jgi:hypothetical protein
MSVRKEISREALTKGPGSNVYIIPSRTFKEKIKTFSKGSFLPVLISPLGFSSYLKEKYSLKPGSANRILL